MLIVFIKHVHVRYEVLLCTIWLANHQPMLNLLAKVKFHSKNIANQLFNKLIIKFITLQIMISS